ncbi:MAG TPA: AAA family ATPase [Marinobacter sp.]|nr:AAA family ATPase [Marinobacter sp.]
MAQDTLNSLDGGGLFPRLQQRYGLRENPLEIDAPFFPDAMRQHALESLRHLCGFGDMALVVTGAQGAGKTRLLAELVRSESARLEFHRVPASALTSATALARDLRRSSRSGIPEGLDPREAVYRYFKWSESRVQRGQRQILLIDDADRVPPEILNLLLSAFASADRAIAAVPVFAGTDVVSQVLTRGTDSGYLHQLNLPPLTRDDIAAYLEPRVHRAGGPLDELLSSHRLKQIHLLSQGSFGRLKRVTPGIWLDMVASTRSPSRLKLPSLESLRWPALAVVLLGASWWLVSKQYDEAVLMQPEPARAPEPIRKSITIGPESPESEAPDAEIGPQAAEPVLVDRVPEDPIESEPKIELEARPEPVQIPKEPEPEPEPEPAFKPVRAERFVALDDLRQRSGWTLQLVAGQREQTVVSVLDRLPENSSLSYTLGERQGEPWFMLVFGTYSTYKEAESAASNLPGALGIERPWIRAYENF